MTSNEDMFEEKNKHSGVILKSLIDNAKIIE